MWRVLLALAWCLLAPGLALAQPATPQQPGPPQAPFLRVEVGAHVAPVLRALPLSDGQRLLTVSRDKTARVWSADGALLRTFRPPIASGDEGVLLAASVAPDGETAWVGGSTGAAWGQQALVYVFNIATGRMRRLPTGVGATITALTHSPDGQRIAIGFTRDAGIAVVDLRQRSLDRYPDLGIRGGVLGLAFAPNGHLAVASGDGMVRLFSPALREVASHRLPQGGLPGEVAFSADGRLLAVGLANMPEVRLLDAVNLQPRGTPPVGQALGRERQHLRSVAWTGPAGRQVLFAAGHVLDPAGRPVALRWANTAQPAQAVLLPGSDAILHLAAMPRSDALAYATGDAAWGLMQADGRQMLRVAPARLDFRGLGTANLRVLPDRTEFGVLTERAGLRVSSDGLVLDLPTEPGSTTRLRVSLLDRQVGIATTEPPPASPIQSLPLRDWVNGLTPRLGDRPLLLEADERARSAALLPGDAGLLLGTDHGLRWFLPDGTPRAMVVTPAAVWGVAVTGDGRQAVAALGDGTLRWYDLNPRGPLEPRVALFVHSDRRRWLLWTPEGFFDHADEGGQDLAGFHLNRTEGEAADWVDFSQLHRIFHAGDLVRARLSFGDETTLAARVAAIGDVRRLLDRVAPPEVALVALCYSAAGGEECQRPRGIATTRGLGRPQPQAAATPVAAQPAPAVRLPPGVTEVVLRADLQDRGGGVGQVDLLLNGRNVGRTAAARGLGRPSATQQAQTVPGHNYERRVRLEPGVNTLRLRAFDAGNAAFGQSDIVEVQVTEIAPPSRPVLHVLAIGVDDYSATAAQGIRSLANAVNDARTVAAEFRTRFASDYDRVQATVLSDREASRESIASAFERLRSEVREQDTLVVFLAGHGLNQADRYLFIPHLPEGTSLDDARRFALDDQTLVALWSAVPARNSILLLDTCHAGAFNMDFAATLQNETGRFVLAAASAQQEAADQAAGRRNSPFSVAVQEALRGDPRRPSGAAGIVDQLAVGFHVRNRVPVLAREVGLEQRVSFRMSSGEVPLPFALTRIGP
ncbi:WD40 repeat domain-containing protein [Falsiroseomonas stagni]|uniref:Caspase domain-containing protein n=1 Tax=Falsiroseomonas stagni DSM 19981 TaxID=1123062 RepID=A0A1I4F8U1_9PROT|nr:caspase family protein [Falsiroseomonas stagni]SFL13206.1 Caspase domain-containing protein [Falsiroseomonas stagni DSM 19981]